MSIGSLADPTSCNLSRPQNVPSNEPNHFLFVSIIVCVYSAIDSEDDIVEKKGSSNSSVFKAIRWDEYPKFISFYAI